ncbi:alcohol dehydrogenase catalytic domain-containing protein [Maritimibacter dapengensis]|uniref:Alcohol dehydrogenase-like N-terminal domain-containing protein n=1 Tax=Maritimibacter dapengensis TaxID=2836868 RepID=A0ABS6T3X7_9RHOB|nr:hypothetical protein [Maritimibacter dapengensis]MBV7379932.1 hypothetical protein [Maritimibacter dapengensis]
MTRMTAVQIREGDTDFAVCEVAKPDCAPGAAVVRMEAAMVASYMGALPSGAWTTPPRPFTPGQCAIGIVDAAQGDLEPGQRVYFDAFTGSRSADDPAPDHGFLGCFGLGEGAKGPMADWPNGSFAEFVHAPTAYFTPLPNWSIEPALLCRIGWLGTALRGLREAGFRPGMRIAINGASGVVGASAAVLALAMGASRIEVVGRNPDRLAALVALDPARIVASTDGNGSALDLVLDCASGDAGAISTTLIGRLRRFAKAAFVGGLSSPLMLDAGALMRNSNAVIGSYWFTKADLDQVIAMIDSGVLDMSVFTARPFALGDVAQAIDHAAGHAGGLVHTALVP